MPELGWHTPQGSQAKNSRKDIHEEARVQRKAQTGETAEGVCCAIVYIQIVSSSLVQVLEVEGGNHSQVTSAWGNGPLSTSRAVENH